jgi:hypothetical protein
MARLTLGTGEIDEHVDLLDVDPLLADIGADVGFVSDDRRDQVDLPALGEKAESSIAICAATDEPGPPISA